jgi:hypothetical protein
MQPDTLSAPAIIRNVEAFLAQQYAKREAAQHPVDGVVVILVWCVVVLLIWK